jgi:hypothetical protein
MVGTGPGSQGQPQYNTTQPYTPPTDLTAGQAGATGKVSNPYYDSTSPMYGKPDPALGPSGGAINNQMSQNPLLPWQPTAGQTGQTGGPQAGATGRPQPVASMDNWASTPQGMAEEATMRANDKFPLHQAAVMPGAGQVSGIQTNPVPGVAPSLSDSTGGKSSKGGSPPDMAGGAVGPGATPGMGKGGPPGVPAGPAAATPATAAAPTTFTQGLGGGPAGAAGLGGSAANAWEKQGKPGDSWQAGWDANQAPGANASKIDLNQFAPGMSESQMFQLASAQGNNSPLTQALQQKFGLQAYNSKVNQFGDTGANPDSNGAHQINMMTNPAYASQWSAMAPQQKTAIMADLAKSSYGNLPQVQAMMKAQGYQGAFAGAGAAYDPTAGNTPNAPAAPAAPTPATPGAWDGQYVFSPQYGSVRSDDPRLKTP